MLHRFSIVILIFFFCSCKNSELSISESFTESSWEQQLNRHSKGDLCKKYIQFDNDSLKVSIIHSCEDESKKTEVYGNYRISDDLIITQFPLAEIDQIDSLKIVHLTDSVALIYRINASEYIIYRTSMD